MSETRIIDSGEYVVIPNSGLSLPIGVRGSDGKIVTNSDGRPVTTNVMELISNIGIRGGNVEHLGNDYVVTDGTPYLAVADGKVTKVIEQPMNQKDGWGGGSVVFYEYVDPKTNTLQTMSYLHCSDVSEIQEQLKNGSVSFKKGDYIGAVSGKGHLHLNATVGDTAISEDKPIRQKNLLDSDALFLRDSQQYDVVWQDGKKFVSVPNTDGTTKLVSYDEFAKTNPTAITYVYHKGKKIVEGKFTNADFDKNGNQLGTYYNSKTHSKTNSASGDYSGNNKSNSGGSGGGSNGISSLGSDFSSGDFKELPEPMSPDTVIVYLKVGKYDTFGKGGEGGYFDFTPIPPEHVQSFTHTVVADGVSNLNITLFDFTALKLEEIFRRLGLANAAIPISFFYGFVRNQHFSPVYHMMVLDYSLYFTNGGTTLTVTMMSANGFLLSLNKKYLYILGADGNPGLAAKTFTENYLKLKADVVPTKSNVMEHDKTNTYMKFINNNLENGLTFLRKCCKYAVSAATNAAGYRVCLDDTSSTVQVGNLAELKPIAVENGGYNRIKLNVRGASPTKNVISFSPNFQGSAFMAAYGKSVVSNYFNLFNNSVQTNYVNLKTNGNVSKELSGKVNTSPVSSTNISASTSKTNAMSATKNLSSLLSEFFVKAQIDVYGYLQFRILQELFITVYVNGDQLYGSRDVSVVKGESGTSGLMGGIHHTSGLYKVFGILYSYSGGSINATLELQKMGSANGADKGLAEAENARQKKITETLSQIGK